MTPAEYLTDTIARIRARQEWVQLGLSEAGYGPGEWVAFEAFAAPDLRDRAVQAVRDRYRGDGDLPLTVASTYLFRDLVLYPLLLAACCFIEARRVPLLGGAVEVRIDEPGSVRIRDARCAVLAGDPLAGHPGVEVEPDLAALHDRLFSEVTALCDPLIASFREPGYVAVANAWGGILDALAQYGVAAAAELGLGMDEAWARWEAALADRTLPVRRRPRRLAYERAAGQRDELTVRAGCCLYYTTEEARSGSDQRYCTTCYLERDERRIRHVVEWKRAQAAGDANAHE